MSKADTALFIAFLVQLEAIEAKRAENQLRESILNQQIERISSWKTGVYRA